MADADLSPVDRAVPLVDWLDAAAAKRPTPGGGAAAAVAGALAAAMGAMTLRYSVGRKSNSDADEQTLARCLAELDRARVVLLRLSEEDQLAYGAWRMAKELDETDPSREHRLSAAASMCIAVPQSILATAGSILSLAVEAAPVASPWLLSDLRVCGDLATAAARCARSNVLANLSDLPGDQAASLRAEADAAVAESVRRVRALEQAIDAR